MCRRRATNFNSWPNDSLPALVNTSIDPQGDGGVLVTIARPVCFDEEARPESAPRPGELAVDYAHRQQNTWHNREMLERKLRDKATIRKAFSEHAEAVAFVNATLENHDIYMPVTPALGNARRCIRGAGFARYCAGTVQRVPPAS